MYFNATLLKLSSQLYNSIYLSVHLLRITLHLILNKYKKKHRASSFTVQSEIETNDNIIILS